MMKAITMLAAVCIAPYAAAQSAHGSLDSKGEIRNTGTLRILGDARIEQADITGWVEYGGNDAADSQLVAPISYANLLLRGAARKHVDTGIAGVQVREFLSTSIEATTRLVAGVPLLARGGVEHNGRFDHPADSAILRLAGSQPQRLSGVGSMPILEIDNPTSVALLDDAMIVVGRRLDLQRGILDNRSLGWLLLAENAWLYRHDAASITAPVIPTSHMHLRYYGTRRMRAGAELPLISDILGNLYQHNEAGVELSWDAAVHDTLVLRGNLVTESNDRQHSLTYTSTTDPLFERPLAEVDGTLIRTHVPIGTPVVMNTTTTTVRFADSAARGNVAAIALRVKPRTSPPGTGASHVQRFFQLAMLDTNAIEVADSTSTAELSLAWRTQPLPDAVQDSVTEVPPDLTAIQDSLVLQRYDQGVYDDHGRTAHPTIVDPTLPGWRTAHVSSVRSGGDYAIGLSAWTPQATFNVTWLLEGAMQQQGTALMQTVLRERDLIPRETPSDYPFQLHQGLTGVSASVLPDSVVDWVVMELRSEITGGRRYYAAALLSKNGHVLHPGDMGPVSVRSIRTGMYHLVMHHRNHLSVMSAQRVAVQPDKTVRRIDLTAGGNVLGGASALTPVRTAWGDRVWAAPVGDAQRSSSIDRDDWARWLDASPETGYLVLDTSMDGVVSTNDLNLIWNNRGRSSAVP